MSDSVRPHRRQPTRLPRPWDSPGKNTGVGCHFLLHCMKVKSESEVAQSCPTLSDPMNCSLPGSSIHGIFQARVLEWGAITFLTLTPPHIQFLLLIPRHHPLTVKRKAMEGDPGRPSRTLSSGGAADCQRRRPLNMDKEEQTHKYASYPQIHVGDKAM